jgi:hypothetical protein
LISWVSLQGSDKSPHLMLFPLTRPRTTPATARRIS